MRNSVSAVCFISGFSFAALYLLSFYAASSTYPFFSYYPADLSRGTSWVYYGIIFSVVPYLPIGMLFGLLRADIHKTALATILVSVALEKWGLLAAAAALAQRASGYALLCEELPFYCADYKYGYIPGSIVIGTLSFYAGYKLADKVLQRNGTWRQSD